MAASLGLCLPQVLNNLGLLLDLCQQLQSMRVRAPLIFMLNVKLSLKVL